uniref:Uncharacterized protein n=1 Tax=Tanacetum cinerariifolium TaxID=118510 RepID=A0A699IVF0_TANCI|nr:hypothetical protein [Tanacetum cinerariifolium]
MKIFPMLTLLVLVLALTCKVEDSKATTVENTIDSKTTTVENTTPKGCYPGDNDNNFAIFVCLCSFSVLRNEHEQPYFLINEHEQENLFV